MKKTVISIFLAFMIIGTLPALGAVHHYVPNPANLYNLDHYEAYTWGIDWEFTDERIDEAILTFTDIHDWWVESDDILFTRLLDNPELGVTVFIDDQEIGDYFEGQGVPIGTWSDPSGGPVGTGFNLSFKFSELGLIDDLRNFASDGRFGFAFDPDCHYWNSGVKLAVITDTPEPATMLLFGLGTLGLAAFSRKRK